MDPRISFCVSALIVMLFYYYPAVDSLPAVNNSTSAPGNAGSTTESAEEEDDATTPVPLSGPMANEMALFKTLFDKYDKNIRPNYNTTEPLLVELGLVIRRIEYLDEKRQTLLFHATTRLRWKDQRLSWNMDDYDRVQDIAYSSFALWVPDIRLANQAGDVGAKAFEYVLANVYNDGQVLLSTPSAFKVYCGMDFGRWPYDVQTCVIEFESFTHDGTRVNLQLMGANQSFAAQVSPYASTNEWHVLGLLAETRIKTYECCPGQYHSIYFMIRLQRNEPFYRPLMLTPMILTLFASWLLFLLPLKNPTKFAMGAIELVFTASFALFLKSYLPPSLEEVPYIVNLTLNTMVLILLALLTQAFLYWMSRLKWHMPVPIRTFFLDGVGRFCCIKQPSGYMKNSVLQVGTDDQEGDHFEMGDSTEALVIEKSRQEWFTLASALNRVVFGIYAVISLIVIL